MDMIAAIEKELGIEAKKEMLPMQPGDVHETFADIEKAKTKLDYETNYAYKCGGTQIY